MSIGKRMGAWALFALALLFAFSSFGCGGGGAASGLPGTNFFISDAPASDYDQVWVRVFKVEAAGSAGPTAVFQSSDGVVMDLASLNDGSPRFAFLGSGNLPEGTTSLKIELESQVAMVPQGGDQAEMCTIASAYAAGNGHSVLTVPFSAPPGTTDVVMDFDLSAWVVTDGVVEPVVTIGPGTGLGSFDRHEETTHIGTVSGLEGTPPAQSFVLTTEDGRMFAVTTTEATVVFDENGAMASIQNGQRVVIDGFFSMESNAFLAGSVYILGANDHPHFMLGRAFDPNLASSTFLCEVKRVHGFIPNHRIVTVSTPEGTTFLAPSGEPITKERFYLAIADGQKFVIAGGHYDGSVNVFTARVVKLHHRHDDRHEVRASGEILELAPDRHMFMMRVHEWHGHEDHTGEREKVVTGEETQFFAPDGSPITQAQFYDRARPGTVVGVEGLYADQVIRARKVMVRHWGEGNDLDVAHGRVTETNPAESVFGLHLREWVGFEPPGDVIRVLVTDDTVIVDLAGNSFTKEQFFHEMRPGGSVSVFGHFDGHMTARKIIVHEWEHHVRFVGAAIEWSADLDLIVLEVPENPLGGDGTHVRVHTSGETAFFIGETPVDKAAFYAALAVGLRVGVEGWAEGDGVHAASCHLMAL